MSKATKSQTRQENLEQANSTKAKQAKLSQAGQANPSLVKKPRRTWVERMRNLQSRKSLAAIDEATNGSPALSTFIWELELSWVVM